VHQIVPNNKLVR